MGSSKLSGPVRGQVQTGNSLSKEQHDSGVQEPACPLLAKLQILLSDEEDLCLPFTYGPGCGYRLQKRPLSPVMVLSNTSGPWLLPLTLKILKNVLHITDIFPLSTGCFYSLLDPNLRAPLVIA